MNILAKQYLGTGKSWCWYGYGLHILDATKILTTKFTLKKLKIKRKESEQHQCIKFKTKEALLILTMK